MKRILFLIIYFLSGLLQTGYAQQNRVEKAQEQARVHTDLANRYYQVGQVSTAVEEAKAALRSVVDYVPAYTVLALIYAQLHQNDLADAHFMAALDAAAAQKLSQTEVRNNYAEYLCRTNRGEQALQEFASVLRDPLFTNMTQALISAGKCAARLKRNDLATPYLDAVLDVEPNNVAAYIYRAHVRIGTADYAGAQSDIRKASAVAANEPELLWAQARLARVQNPQLFEGILRQLQRDYPTSEQAGFARVNNYDVF